VHDIIKRLQARPFQSAAQLAKAIEGVSKKTVLRDVKFMKEQLDLPLKYHEKKHGFYFTEPVSEFAPMQLSRGELVALFVAEKAVEALKGTRLHKLVQDSLHKIAEACPEYVSLKWQDMDEAFSMKTTGALKSSVEVFSTLMDAVLEQREVEFDYHKLESRRVERRQVRPYHIIQLQQGWYLIAHDPRRGALRKFALQRMNGLKLLKSRFVRDPSFNIRDYLASGFGVWSYPEDAPRFEVRIRFTGWAARYVAERQWHASQSITPINADGSEIEFRAELAGLEEITRWVMSHGRQARVIGPEELVKRVWDELEAMCASPVAPSGRAAPRESPRGIHSGDDP
jgi:proteasome accessory factor B